MNRSSKNERRFDRHIAQGVHARMPGFNPMSDEERERRTVETTSILQKRIQAAKLLSSGDPVRTPDGQEGRIEFVDKKSGNVRVLVQGGRRSLSYGGDLLAKL